MKLNHNIQSILLILIMLLLGVGKGVAGVAYNQIKDGGVYTIANHIINGGGFHNYIWYNTSNSKAAYGPAPDEENYKWIAHKVNSNIYYFENYTHRGKFLNMESGGLTDSPYNYTLSNGHNGATGYITLQNGVTRYGGWYGAYDGTSGSGDRYGFGRYGSGGCISTQGTAQAQNSPYWSTDWELVFTGTYVQPDAPFSLSPSNDEWAENTRWYYINLPYTGGYLGYGSGYSDANGLLVNNTTKPDGEAGLWAIVKVGDRVQFYNKASGRTLVLSAPSGGDPEKLAMLDRTLTVSNQTTANPSIVKENAWSLLPTNKDINGTQSGYFLYRHNSGVWHRCVVFNDNHLVTAYGNGESANASSMEANLVSKMVLIPADVVIPKWDVTISGGTADDKVVFGGIEYISGSKIETESMSATNISTNISNRFVWGPIIDSENHTVTFEVRSTQENTITAGKFYQLQMRDKQGTVWGTSGRQDNVMMAQEVSKWTMRYPGSQIYLTGANKTNSWTVELMGIPTANDAYKTYLYVPSGTAIQMQNSGYIGNDARYSGTANNWNLIHNSGTHSFTWNNNLAPWVNINSISASVGQASAFANGYIELFFHPVSTGEDYDIYKVKNNEAAVVCNSSSLVTTIINAGGTFFFVQKGATLTASDFTINGEEPQSISTTRNGDFIELTLTEAPHEVHEITSLSAIDNMYGRYKLTADVDAPSQITSDFHGHLDGDYHKITGLTHAIFNNIDGAKISNLIIEDVNISGDIVGAIANTATGNSRIYNCGIIATNAKNVDHDQTFTSSSKISGTTAGSIVGKIEGNARVVNCYSYADVNGTNAGGIVGDWAGTWYNGTTGLMVANCMYYGNLTGTNRSPIVYGGSNINGYYSIYSYFRWKSMSNTSFTRQNGALAATEDIWLDRFKFFQAGVTNHRDIAAYYVFGDASRISDIGQWYIDETIAPWPILRKAEKRTTILSKATQVISSSAADKEPNTGAIITDVKNDITKRYDKMPGTNGKLTVNFTINGTNFTKDLPITDMDDKHYDYTWGKVVLPFANEFEGWTMPTSSDVKCGKICIGWKVTGVTGGSASSIEDYNFADRDNTSKELYSQSHYIFAQGGNYIVPYGVTEINVEAHFADAYYLADAQYDNTHGGTRPTTYNGKTLYTSVANAWAAMSDNTMPHDQAIVLVGNYHYNSNVSGGHTAKGCTIMSIDEDGDQQPDYGWYSSVVNARVSWPAIRWDFITIPSFGMLQKGLDVPGLNIPAASGWFEITETCLSRTFEFEISDYRMTRTLATAGNTNAYIIKGGWFQQLVRCYTESDAVGAATHEKLSYVNVGGNAYIKEFFHGNHSGKQNYYALRPINVTGGEIEQCFMTGMRNNSLIVSTNNNVRFYCSGGKIGKYLSVYQAYPVVDATMKVDHARIGRFFGGGTTPKAQLSGNINITMNYSDIDFFCGGPEFGDMTAGKTVTVNTTGSTFGEYYGAGFGGTALTRARNGEANTTSGIDNYASIRLGYDDGAGGFAISYEMEALIDYQGKSLYRFYDNRAALSKATTGNVTTTATNCLFKNDFFGGGCQGKVSGDVTSILNNCIVSRNAYGGGYKAAATTIDVYPASGHTWQQWNSTYKAFTAPYYPQPVSYTWVHGTAGNKDEDKKILYTAEDLSDLGTVTGNTSLTIKGADSVVTGDVFGGGAESKVLGNSTVVIGEQP